VRYVTVKSIFMKRMVQVFFMTGLMTAATAQNKLPVIRSNQKVITYTNGEQRFTNNWTISPEYKPDVYKASIKGTSSVVKFITDVDSIAFTVKPGDVYDFIVLLNGKDSALTRITGKAFVEQAVFSDAYKAAHNNKIFVEVPQVYELVNIAMALSETGKKDPYIVYKQSAYYKEVMDKFSGFAAHPFVHSIDSLLKGNAYTPAKMDAYAFEFNKKQQVVKSKVYNSIAGEDNMLDGLVAQLQDFARQTGFLSFFNDHQSLYDEQVRYYRDTLNTDKMNRWLRKHFPSSDYNSFKIIFTPLVAYNQSATWFDNNGFKEMQAHVNFPYPGDFKTLGAEAAAVARGNIVFTEINHSFINPEADKPQYTALINTAFADLNKWAEKGKPAASYNSPYSCFNEYMNWVLVSLRYVDYAPAADADMLIEKNGQNMKKRRGFTKFPEFNTYVVQLYRDRKEGVTIADLYPQILDWCSKQ